MTTQKKTAQYSVRVMDMFHYQDEHEEYTIEGFPTFELAKEYARKFVRNQIEEASRNGNGDRGGLKKGLWRYGQDAMVLGGSKREKYSGFDEIDFFIENPGLFEECDYKGVLRKAGIKRP
jgi:hypothetical protein